jgi:hypothetical protein
MSVPPRHVFVLPVLSAKTLTFLTNTVFRAYGHIIKLLIVECSFNFSLSVLCTFHFVYVGTQSVDYIILCCIIFILYCSLSAALQLSCLSPMKHVNK